VSGLPAGSGPSSYDLDGRTTVRSPPIAVPAGVGQRLTFRYLFAHAASSSSADYLRAVVETADGARTVVWERRGSATLAAGTWRYASVAMDAFAGQTIRLRFQAADAGSASTIEVGVDDVRITRPVS
jgi:aminopeptidase S